MLSIITRLRWAPLALGLFFALVTGRVLFDDVIVSPIPLMRGVTTAHLLTLAGIVAAIASGHYAIIEIRRWHLITGTALSALFIGSTGYVVIASGGRSAEQAAIKVVHATNIAERRAAAKAVLEKAEAAHTAAVVYWTTQRDAAAKECSPEKGGKGKKCDGTTETRDAALAVADKRHNDVKEARRAYDALTPALPANAGYAHFAKIVSVFTGAEIEATTAKIALAMPFVIVLVTELATIVFLHMGLTPIDRSYPNPDRSPPTSIKDDRLTRVPPTRGGQPIALPADIVEHPVIKALRRGAANSNDELASRLGESKGEASKKRGEVRDLLIERKLGRQTLIDLKPEVRRALG